MHSEERVYVCGRGRMQRPMGGGKEPQLAVPGSSGADDLRGFSFGDRAYGRLQAGGGGHIDRVNEWKADTQMRSGGEENAFGTQYVRAVLRASTGNIARGNSPGIPEIASQGSKCWGGIAGVGIPAKSD